MNRQDIVSLVRPNILGMSPYSTARDEFKGSIGVFMDANECPFDTGYNRYPDPHQNLLKERVSAIKGIPVERIFIGNGSDEAIDVIMRVFCIPGKDNIVSIAPTYGMYSVEAQINDIEYREVALDSDFRLDTHKLMEACDCNTKLIFLCSPNNPSGNAFPMTQIYEILNSFHGIVVVDEAYADFSSLGSLTADIDRFENLIVLQTLSKARGMAALRVGFAFASDYIVSTMSKVKYPYNINAAAQKIAFNALEGDISERVGTIIRERGRISEALAKFNCIQRVYGSDANFLLVKVDDANALYSHLLAGGIIVRNRNHVSGCEGCIRITVGTEVENDKMLKIVEEYEKGNICR